MALGTFFFDNALACWIYNVQTLRFVEVNTACTTVYKYSREDFLEKLLVTDLSAEIDRPSAEQLYKIIPYKKSPSLLVQKRRNGEVFQAMIFAQAVRLNGQSCSFAMAIERRELLKLGRSRSTYSERM